jgi:energy-coupling factor transporter ATP-binding protein EcfA2
MKRFEVTAMKIQVKNLGILNEVEIDLKPLTIFVGPNNSGKTLLAYVLVAILGQIGFDKYKDTLDRDKIAEMYPPLDGVIQKLIDEGNAKIDLCQFADEYAEVYINDVALNAQKWLAEFMRVERFSFDNLEIKIALEQKKEQILRHIVSSAMDEGISSGQRRKSPLVNATKKQGDQILYFYTSGSIENLFEETICHFVVKKVFEAIHEGIFVDTHVFPTERTTYIPMIASGAKSRRTLDSQVVYQVSGYESNPLTDFLTLMVDSIFRNPGKRNDEVQKHPSMQKYGIFSQMLQKEILGGNLKVVSRDSLGISKELIFVPKPDIELEMNIASSMVKELAALALYLSSSAQPGEWLVMDEPEMHLHPEAQVKLTELLAMLVNADLSLLFTTHSPYIVDHLVNLMRAYEHEDKEIIKEEFYLQETEAFISKESVAVYLFEDGTAKSILDENGRIQWGTFADVSDRVTQIYFDL